MIKQKRRIGKVHAKRQRTIRLLSPLEKELATNVIVHAVLRGVEMGKRVANYLERIGIVNTDQSAWEFPEWFYFDLSIALQIAWWEKVGIAALLPEKLPSSAELLQGIFRDASNPETLLGRKHDQRLGGRVIMLYLHYLSHTQQDNLPTEFFVDQPDSDDLIEAMAHFLVNSQQLSQPYQQ